MSHPDVRRRKSLLILTGVLAAAVLVSFLIWKLRYRASYAADLKDRPWAYTETGARLLTARWEGSFADPAGVEKKLTVEIFTPLTDEEREKKASKRVRNRPGIRSQGSKQSFTGTAQITSTLGAESYELSGSVGKDDHHRIERISFVPEDEAKRVLPNFTAREARPGSWNDTEMTLALYFRKDAADGSSTSTSEGVVVDGEVVWKEDPADRPVTVTLKRL